MASIFRNQILHIRGIYHIRSTVVLIDFIVNKRESTKFRCDQSVFYSNSNNWRVGSALIAHIFNLSFIYFLFAIWCYECSAQMWPSWASPNCFRKTVIITDIKFNAGDVWKCAKFDVHKWHRHKKVNCNFNTNENEILWDFSYYKVKWK